MRLPKNVAARIFHSEIFLFFYQSSRNHQRKLSSSLTEVVHLSNIYTVQDLVHGSYTIYGSRRYQDFYSDHQISAKLYVEVKEYDCTKYMLRDSVSVCVGNKILLMYDASKLNLHRSKDRIVKIYFILAIRDDWPLEQRINTFCTNMVHSGIIDYLHKKSNAKLLYACSWNPWVSVQKSKFQSDYIKTVEIYIRDPRDWPGMRDGEFHLWMQYSSNTSNYSSIFVPVVKACNKYEIY